jgi:AAA family ATP:ADP antiporter
MVTSSAASPLDRFLRLFTDVRAGESGTALLLSTNVFLLLTCYSILKPVREALILGDFSAEIKSYTAAGQVLLLAIVVPLYGKLADGVSRRRLINIVTAIFTVCLLGFYGLAQTEVRIGIIYFIWLGIFSVMLVAQFWSFANDIYSRDEGERLFSLVAFGASFGAVVGAFIASMLIAPFGVNQMLLVAAVLLVAQVGITNYVDRREGTSGCGNPDGDEGSRSVGATGPIRAEEVDARTAELDEAEADTTSGAAAAETDSAQGADAELPVSDDKTAADAPIKGTSGAFGLVLRIRYLLAIGIMILLLNLVNTTGGYILDRVVENTADAAVAEGAAGGLTVEDFIGDFYARFQLVVNIAGLLVQLFLVSRIVKYIGVRFAIMILPLIALGGYALIAFYPVLSYIRWAKTAENSTDYSLNNTVRNMLFLPATREQKYKAKQTIDSFFWRVGDTFSAALVFIGTQLLVLNVNGFALVNLSFVAVWLLLAIWIGKEYKRLVDSGETPS